MAGRIKDEDVAYVRDHSPIDDVVADYVQLKNAGGGQKKGLCPFHDEKSPSFHVTPSKGFFHCFGCQVGGDVIAFIMKLEHLTFMETVERLADRIGYTLRYETSGSSSAPSVNRSRLVAANTAAAIFYQEQIQLPAAQHGRDFLTKRGFDRDAAKNFNVGYAPDEWDGLYKQLKGQGFTDEELTLAGLIKEGSKGPIDRYRNRLIWPVKDISGDVVGFGARKLAADDVDQGPKYLNSPETPIYKKNQILYGLDMAKKEISKNRQVVIVEGYTDVMAAHLAGVTTAVATCGTAFGDEHIRIIRRLLMDADAFRGEVIFTFDGDAAGQKAALRAFEDDQKFVAQTYVAVEPNGMDPCELRQAHGDDAVRNLIARRVPLFEFAIKSVIANYDIKSAEGRVGALNQVAPLIGKIRDASLRPEYVRLLAGWLGMEVDVVSSAVKKAGGAIERLPPAKVNLTDPILVLEREVLKVKLQMPELAPGWVDLEAAAFSFPLYNQLRVLIDQQSELNIQELINKADSDELKSLITELTVEPIRTDGEVSDRYITSIFARLREVALSRLIAEIKSTLQRLNPVENEAQYQEIFTKLVGMEAARRVQKELALGES
ncbi:MAG: DNA primase [Actinobacteria bacterium]|nr:DNA primase [Actinomycetota bacterium]NCA25775.1 DNA primase [Actinomycetota bacterium]NCU78345.1 DNA primase [Actinomycetota bacterium]NCU96479.1 DNA primase [Actinomycetota bacterium]NCZ76739.1 DNA primase [Actinomycetota bacterium]